MYIFFSGEMKACINTHTSEKEQVLTARWVLSNLTSSLQRHLSYVCKIRKCGTLPYWTNGDILAALTNALHRLSRPTSVESNSEGEGSAKTHVTDSMQVALNDINSVMHELIRVFKSRCHMSVSA